jgi:hypothetical protein
MVIKNRAFNQNDFRSFYNDLNNNKSSYNINNALLGSGGKIITIDF